MNKTKRTLIISSCIMALAFIVAVVGISAAWFSDTRIAKNGAFIIQSDTLQDVATIDINAVSDMSGQHLYPAVAQVGYFEGKNPPVGAVLKNITAGIAKAAQCATVYFPIQFIGTPDEGFEGENRKSLDLDLVNATIDLIAVKANGKTEFYEKTESLTDAQLDIYAGTWSAFGLPSLRFDGKGGGSLDGTTFDYAVDKDTAEMTFNVGGTDYVAAFVDFKEDFNAEMSLVEAILDENGKFAEEKAPVYTADHYESPLGGNVFYVNDGYHLYMLVQPGITYYVKTVLYFNRIDEECSFDLLGKSIKFKFKLNIIGDGSVIRDAYRAGGGGIQV